LKPNGIPKDPKSLGEHLKKRRLELGLTQRQTASRIRVKPWNILNWETDRFEPPIRSMPAILAFLGYDPFPPPKTVRERLLHVRRQHGWSTGEAAHQLGVDRTTWQDWEHGKLILFRRHRTKVATLLGLDPKETADEMRARWNGKHRLLAVEQRSGTR
jgi:transcriptional regulator with XRE-family HTH domain